MHIFSDKDFELTCFNYQLTAQFLYSITIYMLYYYPRHVSRVTMLIFRRSIVLSQHLVSSLSVNGLTPVESRLLCSLLSTGVLYYR
jgi:hypothetical protein